MLFVYLLTYIYHTCGGNRFLISADKPLAQVKLGELPSWFSRRSMNPIDWSRAVSRAYWRWNHKFMQPKYCGLTPMIQMAGMYMVFFYTINYGKFSKSEFLMSLS